MEIINISNEKETREYGLKLAKMLKPGDVVALIGDLGTGKTTLTKYIAEGLGIKENVNSPTFTIVKEYQSGRIPLFHFDVYRIENEEELFEIGADEYFYGNGVCVVEWADKVIDSLPENRVTIEIEQGINDDERIYRCTY
ncbi:MAG: tRNA (adenosine(37)-N6)-threonylcarbamoyltransferase complex ATPase subunit type 1 TsaE [Peptostreptococcaceae bacterium]|nr:tRNA (adenosine(37)-N6)-threonylcarbamoyltransferase complex ATPase subunit type 1 TsaE [Peptostreptococcaceae bacterium]